MDNDRVRNIQMAAILALAHMEFPNMFKHNKEVAEKDMKPCLMCKKKHSHNNSFCSAKCCGEYNDKRNAFKDHVQDIIQGL